MEDASTGSIHDIDSAPEAPLHYSLSSLELSPQSNVGSPRTRRQSASFYLAQSSALAVPPLLDDHVTRERSDTAPGRMDNIEETDSTQFENVTSSGNHHLLRRRTRSSGSQEFSDGDDPAASFGEQSKDAQAFEPEQGFETMYWCGIPLPWCKLGCETKVSSCLVRHAPCFWGCGEKLTVGATDRSILYRLNLLSAFFAFFVIIAASFLWFVLEAEFVVDRYPDLVGLKEESDGLFLNLWNLVSLRMFILYSAYSRHRDPSPVLVRTSLLETERERLCAGLLECDHLLYMSVHSQGCNRSEFEGRREIFVGSGVGNACSDILCDKSC